MDSIGLAKLSLVDQILVKSYYTIGRNKYEVRTESGDLLFSAKETGSGLEAWMKGKDRGFEFHFTDTSNTKAISVIWIFGHSYKVIVFIGTTLVSIVRQKPTFCAPVLIINDAMNCQVLRIKRSQLTTLDKQSIGEVSKLSFGFIKNLSSGGKVFRITFPRDLSVEYKVACIGACLYIDFKYHS